ncbi:hypothetical protein GCK72_001861 [Caenorhabditis remanei]|uniref:Uncharacterized protein n=1 Tax=Caenorhabditis remanei TaxID=31234 RepID=E3LMU7_CAERE|nr:hypothetical protein GCK72_001861 [Caenorhabditis remanei]EFP03088.1 hypothetical protein CRE_28505 [Caenorhabditis remanei]KAF1770044.1 hypothetical protein GCK72_001861 [Caenorhabditis remanei]
MAAIIFAVISSQNRMKTTTTPSTSNFTTDFLEKEENGSSSYFLEIFCIVSLIAFIMFHLHIYFKSTRLKERTLFPKSPDWMFKMLDSQKILTPIGDNGQISIATRGYTQQLVVRSGVSVENSKPAIETIRRIIQKIVEIEVSNEFIPGSTCIVSISKRNFRSGTRHAEFVPLNGGPSTSHFEYQMIGEDDRIQVTYFVVGGVSYVAGVCIYVENPYDVRLHYTETIIRRLMNSPDYWSKNELEEETTSVVRRKSNYEYVLITKNRYGDVKHSEFHGDKKSFDPVDILPLSAYINNPEREDLKFQAKNLCIRICEFQKKIVMITERNGHNLHTIWNEKKGKLDFFECASCDLPQEAPPPSYNSFIRNSIKKPVNLF